MYKLSSSHTHVALTVTYTTTPESKAGYIKYHDILASNRAPPMAPPQAPAALAHISRHSSHSGLTRHMSQYFQGGRPAGGVLTLRWCWTGWMSIARDFPM